VSERLSIDGYLAGREQLRRRLFRNNRAVESTVLVAFDRPASAVFE
jgi:hypothetical protein